MQNLDIYSNEGTMEFIAAELGTAFRDKMIATMGGTEIKVPSRKKTLGDNHHLVRSLGRIDAEELVEVAGGESFAIPLRRPSNRAAVVRLVMAGKNNTEIARELGITSRQVRRLRAQSGLNGVELSARLGVANQHLNVALSRKPSHLIAAQ